MSIDARLNRLLPVLSARERAVLVLRSLKGETTENPLWRRSIPREQVAEFNRLIMLINACNIYLPLYITVVEQQTEQLYLRFFWLQSVVALGEQTWSLAQLVPAGKYAQAEEVVQACFPAAELPWQAGDNAYSWPSVAEAQQEGVRRLLLSLWAELRSIDIVLEEVAREFDGEDPLRPIMREVVEQTRKKLTGLHEVLAAAEALELREPDEETLSLARSYFEDGRRLMNKLTR